jgi:hypothetical protein
MRLLSVHSYKNNKFSRFIKAMLLSGILGFAVGFLAGLKF